MQERRFSLEMPWKGEVTRVEARFVPVENVGGELDVGRLMFTPAGEETFWVVQGCNDGPLAAFELDSTDEELERALRCALATPPQEKFYFERCFEVPLGREDQTFYIALEEDFGRGGVCRVSLRIEEAGIKVGEQPIHLPVSHREFCTWPSQRIEAWVTEQCWNPASEICCFVWWENLDHQERLAFLQDKVEGFQELHQVIGWILLADNQASQAFSHWFAESYRWSFNGGKPLRSEDLHPFLAQLRDFLKARFLPLSIKGMKVTPSCIKVQMKLMLESPFWRSSTTHHERMEAMLSLRDWLRGQMSGEEFEALWGLSREVSEGAV